MKEGRRNRKEREEERVTCKEAEQGKGRGEGRVGRRRMKEVESKVVYHATRK